MKDTDIIIATRLWVQNFVVNYYICPFARAEVERERIHYAVSHWTNYELALQALFNECDRLDSSIEIETTLVIYPKGFNDFNDFMQLVYLAEQLIVELDYEGVYQVASFHPDYHFADAEPDDPGNFTNRTPFPMLQLLREASVSRALSHYPNSEKIPERNIEFCRQQGTDKLSELLNQCYEAIKQKRDISSCFCHGPMQ